MESTVFFNDRYEWHMMIEHCVKEGLTFRARHLPTDSRWPYQLEFIGGY